MDAFQVALSAGKAATFKLNYLHADGAVQPAQPSLQLYDPFGNEVCGPLPGYDHVRTSESDGIYTALVSSCAAPLKADYRVEFYDADCPSGPTITEFGLADQFLVPVAPTGFDPDGRPIFNHAFGQGFSLVVEARAGANGRRAGDSTVSYDAGGTTQEPDQQMILNRPLGDGNATVCDIDLPNQGGVPATVPLVFDSTPGTLAHIEDMGCRFDDGSGQHLGVRESSLACTKTGRGFGFSFVDSLSAIQYCAQIASAWSFPDGANPDTIVAARVKDRLGNFGATREIVVRIGDPSPAPPTPTATPTRSATNTRTATRTPTGPTPTITSTPNTTCAGDCNGNHVVAVNEIILMIDIAFGDAPLSRCPAGDADNDGMITISDLLKAVNNLLNGCPAGA